MNDKFKIIQKEKWSRKEHFDFFSNDDGSPLYEITTHLDVSDFYDYIKKNQLSFYYSLIWATTEVINEIENFRYKIRGEDVILHSRLIPSFTDIKKDSELFQIAVVDIYGSIFAFNDEAKKITKEQQSYFSTALSNYDDDALIQFSCVPWISYTSLNMERSKDNNDSITKITWGKYERIAEKLLLPFTVQANHKLIDGYHLGQFFIKLQNFIDNM